MNNLTQPTILVKKTDGASVRMTMDELQAYKTLHQNDAGLKSEPKKSAPVPAPIPAPMPAQPPKPAAPSKPFVQLVKQNKQEEKPIPKPPEKKFVRPVPPAEEKM